MAAVLLLSVPLRAQVRKGSLIVWIVSQRADYVVVGAESRDVDLDWKYLDDKSCKIISLGGDTLFFATGHVQVLVNRGKSWDGKATARNLYTDSQKRDALSLANRWGTEALRWFSTQPLRELEAGATGPVGILVTAGFITFDTTGTLSIEQMSIAFDSTTKTLIRHLSSQAPGKVGASGVATDLISEFFGAKTERAFRAFAPAGVLPKVGFDPTEDTRLVRQAIKFVIDNAAPQNKLSLGGDIDVATIRNNRTIRWNARKQSCAQEDTKPKRAVKGSE